MGSKQGEEMDGYVTYMGKKDAMRSVLARHTLKALEGLPVSQALAILDMGSGTGVVTLSLLRQCNAQATCVDLDPDALSILSHNAHLLGLDGRVEVLCRDMRDIEIRQGCFDLVISEGSVQFVGMEYALSHWGRMLRQGGLMIIHTDRGDKEGRVAMMGEQGYDVVRMEDITVDNWIDEYFVPLSHLLISSMAAPLRDSPLEAVLKQDARDTYASLENPSTLGSRIYILRKK